MSETELMEMESGNLGRPNIRSTVKPLLVLLKVAGIYYDITSNPRTKRLAQVYCFIVNLSFWTNTARLYWCLKNTYSIDSNVLMGTSTIIFYTWATVTLTCFTITSPSHLPKILNAAQKIQNNNGERSYMKDSQTKIRRLVVITTTLNVILATSLLTAISLSDEVKAGGMCVMAPFTADQPLQFYSLLPFNLIVSTWLGLGFLTLFFGNMLACYFLGKEFTENASCLNNSLDVKKLISANDVERVRHHYEDIVQLVQKCNKVFSFSNLALYGTIIPFCCFFIFGITTETYSLVFTLQAIFDATVVVADSVILTLAGVYVTRKAHALKDTIMRADFCQTDNKVNHSLSIFLARLTGNPVGLWAGGLFMVDWPAFLTIYGLVLTYTVVIFQFQIPTTSSAVTFNTTQMP